MYAMVAMCPDLAYAVGALSKHAPLPQTGTFCSIKTSFPLPTWHNGHPPHLQEDVGNVPAGLCQHGLGWQCQWSLVNLWLHFHYSWSSYQLVVKELTVHCSLEHRSWICGCHRHWEGRHLAKAIVFRDWAITLMHTHQAINWQSVGNVSCKKCHFPWSDEAHRNSSSLHQGTGCRCTHETSQLRETHSFYRRYGFAPIVVFKPKLAGSTQSAAELLR